jgi:ATP-dependent Lon protease
MSNTFKKKIDVVSHATKLTQDVNPSALKEIAKLINSKMLKIQEIIQRILQTLNFYRGLNIISNSDLIVCTSTLIECFDKSLSITSKLEPFILSRETHSGDNPRIPPSTSPECFAKPILSTPSSQSVNTDCNVEQINVYIEQLQHIVDKMSIIMCGYGAASIEDIFFISFGSEIETHFPPELDIWKEKRNLILNHVRPIGYKTFHWKQSRTKPKYTSDTGYPSSASYPVCTNKIIEDAIQIELANQYECFDIDFTGKTNYVKIYGIRVVVHNEKTQKTLIIQGLVDDIPIECIHNGYLNQRKKDMRDIIKMVDESNDKPKSELMHRLLETITIKDALINGTEDFFKKTYTILSDVTQVKINKLTATIRRFLDLDIYNQRSMIMNLLIYNQDDDVQYITYLLYDLISAKNSSGSTIDSTEQQMIYDSFPWKIKLYFKETMKHTIKYTKDMISKYDVNRISLEQQIYVMKVPDNVREKAMAKLKEIKGKSDDSGAKAKQYLEGLLKIPFGIYREETILKKPKQLNTLFLDAIHMIEESKQTEFIAKYMGGKLKTHYTALEIMQLSELYKKWIKTFIIEYVRSNLSTFGTKQITQLWNVFCSEYIENDKKSLTKQLKIGTLKDKIESCNEYTLCKMIDELSGTASEHSNKKTLTELQKSRTIASEFKCDLDNIVNVLDDSIYGHESAKNQILKIIGQWMNGEQSGYCFGFEGSPGVGKTSLAKRGLANCLKDENGSSRPFSFIALGGSCNGSTLEGHSYTYVNSTWGRIVDILMDSKCLNPIIYIDELDKVSKTEHGKEIIGILMHLIDTTQNSGFQDKYFSGIDIDLSKVLFIFSYNDPAQIDSILLDRIHRIKFDNLSIKEKLVITRKYILPEIDKKMGIGGCIELSDDIISHIIETYTLESGVRKLKEVIFDLYGEINIELLKCENVDTIQLPIQITVELLETKYLEKYDKMRETKIHKTDQVGIVNGLWANSLGRGGIIPIQGMFFPTSTFLDLRLTGMQGDVMKESMNVAKSLAWNLLTESERKKCLEKFEQTKEQGIHIHCPDGATPKDGPSAGAAITSVIYSILSGKPIKHDIALTGEINLQGKVTEIGGLEQKIIGGIRAGVKSFLYPSSNSPEFTKFMQKYNSTHILEGIQFKSVSDITEVFNEVYSQ